MKKTIRTFFKKSITVFPYLMILFLVLSVIFEWYKCPFYSLLGIPCAGCGMTRAMKALFDFDINKAFRLHCLFPIPIIWAAYYFLKKIFNWNGSIPKTFETILLAISLTLFIARWLLILFST